MLEAKAIQELINELDYIDVSLVDFTCVPFVHKAVLIFSLSDLSKITFVGCCKICVEHHWGERGSYWNDSPISEWKKEQLANVFMMRDIEVKNTKKCNVDYYKFNIIADTIEIKIICKNIEINDQKLEDYISNKT